MASAKYMREYRKRYRETPEGRAKILAGRKRWKKSELGKQRARARKEKLRSAPFAQEAFRRRKAAPQKGVVRQNDKSS